MKEKAENLSGHKYHIPNSTVKDGQQDHVLENVSPAKLVTRTQASSLLEVTYVLLEQASCAQRELDLRRFFLK